MQHNLHRLINIKMCGQHNCLCDTKMRNLQKGKKKKEGTDKNTISRVLLSL